MPRPRSESTIQKVDYIKGLIAKDESITQRELLDKVAKKFGTGLSFTIISKVKQGKDPFAKTKGGKRGAKKKTRGATAGPAARPGKGRRGRPVSNPFSHSPAYIVAVPEESIARPAEGKIDVRREVAALLEQGFSPEDVLVYGRESVKIEVSHKVSL